LNKFYRAWKNIGTLLKMFAAITNNLVLGQIFLLKFF